METIDKIDARSISPKAQESIRRLAVKAVLEGKKQLEVAEIFGVTRQAVGKWVKAHRMGGIQALKAKKQGRPKGGSLLPWQAAQVAKAVVDHHPEQLKLPFFLWTRESVAKLIHQKFRKRLSIWTVGRYLKRWGFSPQKPVRRAFEQKPEAVRQWLDVEYPAIHKQAKVEKAQIFWGDEMGLRSNHAIGRTYGLRGQTPVVSVTGKRFGCNMVSAITNQGHLNFMVFKGQFVGDVFIDFLKRLISQYHRKIFLIIDRHPVHCSKKVKNWVADHSDQISIWFLPGYSPELNPDELLNQDVKSNTMRKNRPRNQHELLRNVRSYLRKRQRQPHIVERFFLGKDVRYAA